MDTNQNAQQSRLPSNIPAERTVLGLMLLDVGNSYYGVERLREQDFFDKSNALIFAAMKELNRTQTEIDTLTVGDYLQTTKKDVITGGRQYLDKLVEEAFTKSNLESYVDIIIEKSMLRSIMKLSTELLEESAVSVDAQSVLERAEREILNISLGRKNAEFVKISDVIDDLMKSIEEMPPVIGGLTGLNTGIKSLNEKLQGFQKSDLIILAARPSVGKTALALNFAYNAAINSKATVGIFSLEMSREQVAARMLSMASLVELNKIKRGNLDDEDFKLILHALQKFRKTNIFISQAPGASVNEIRSRSRKLKAKHGLDMIVIDYLQLMSGEGESQQVMVSNISRSLKALAMEMDCPVIALSQLSRKAEERKDHRPVLSDLRDSGSIEQDADVVMLLYRDGYYEKEDPTKKNHAEIDIAKHRNGEVGTLKLFWKPEVQQFQMVIQDDVFYD